MTDDTPPPLSDATLATLFGEALRVGVNAAPLETPDWWQEPAFPYVPVAFTGRGGSGFVWKASRRDGHGLVALKLVPFRTDPIRLQQRWEDECAALQKIQHPNLVAYIDHGLSPDGLSGWLAMEWIEGTCLDRRLATEGPLLLKEVKLLVPQAVAGLSALHAAGFVHRDIKPSNLLFESATSRLVVADLGIAHDLAADPDVRVTRTLERPLTPGYAPPELLHSSYQPTPAGDQYSLAFTIWQLLTGSLPLGAFPSLNRLCRCPDSLNAVLRHALAPDPDRRYPDIASFGSAFQKAASRPSRTRLLSVFLFLLAITGSLLWLNRPAPFPKRFQTGDLPVDPPRLQYVTVDLTIQKSGEANGTVRVRSNDPFYGCTPALTLNLRAKDGTILETRNHPCFGVNGTWMVGHPSDRIEQWKTTFAPEIAAKLATIDFAVARDGRTFLNRNGENLRDLRQALETYQETFKRGLGQ
ncbi:MAG: serine/threonine-protein kinase [Verrucomicrobiota bacterium]